MSVVRCACCDLPTYSCGKNAETRQRQHQQAGRTTLFAAGWIPAQYPGVCCRCGDVIEVDSLIRRDGDGWLGECCAP